MKQKTQYKKTSIGFIPIDWELKKLGDLTNITAGGTPSTAKPSFWGGDIRWMTSGELNLKFIYEVEGRITEEGLKNSSTKIIPIRCILIGLAGQGKTRGTVAMNMIELCTNQSIAAIYPSNSFVEEFLYFNLDARYNEIRLLSTGDGGRGGLNLSILKSLQIPLPPLLEQQKIAEILSIWDKAIQEISILIKKLEERNKALAFSLLTEKKRLKGFEDNWELQSFRKIINRVTKKNEELDDTVVTISAKRGFILQEDFFKKRVASDTLSGYYLLKKGQFAYNKSYSNGYPMGVFKRLNDFDKAVVTTLYICFELKENICSDFMVHFFENGLMTNNLMKIAKEGGRAHGLLNIGLDDFMNLKLIIPSLEEQIAITEILNTAHQELKQYKEKLKALQQQKKGLMQKLLTGKVRTV